VRRLILILALALASCSGGAGSFDAAPDGRPDAWAVIDAMPIDAVCDPECAWPCAGGSLCADGTAWLNAADPVDCCYDDQPWPGPGPLCAVTPLACTGGACATPDPRYAACLDRLGRADAKDAEELLRLYCPQGAARSAGDSCLSDTDCRPAAEGVIALRCDGVTCVEATRPAAPADYGASCGLDPGALVWLDNGELATDGFDCAVCQVARFGGACLQQGCTLLCNFDEDCPEGSICLCGATPSTAVGYCAAATDRDTAAGRAAGLAACL
jgi:hypothetical protein